MKNRNEKKFTLVELLVVISIIALLAALLLPAISGVRKYAEKVKAQTLAKSLETAITQYEAQYGVLPVKATDMDTSTEKLSDDKYNALLAILTQVDITGSEGLKDQGNPRKTRFLSISQNEYKTNGYVDPWGNKFKIGIDANYDGDVTTFAPYGTLHGKVFVFSAGEDGDPDTDSDNIISWE